MPLPIVADSLDAIPESARGAYVEREGKFHLDAQFEDTSGLKQKNKDLLDRNKKLSAFATIAGERTPEEIAELLKNHDDSETERQKRAGEFDKLLEKRVNETKTEYDKRIAELEPFKAKYEDRELQIGISEAALKGGVIKEDLKAVLKITKGDRIKLNDKGKPVVIDEDGDESGQSLEQFFAETFKKEYPKFYEPSGSSGSDARNDSSRGGGAGTVVIPKNATPAEYRRMKADAEKRGVPYKIAD